MNPDFIVITGGSAGGHLSSLAALTPNDPTFQPGFEEIDTSVRACVPFYGVYDFIDEHGQNPSDGLAHTLETSVMKGRPDEKPEDYEAASPLHRVSESAPPFFVIHGDKDTLVPIRHAHDLVRRLRETSLEHAAFAVLPGGQHAFELFSSPRTQLTVNGVERYVSWIYSRYRAERKDQAEA
jgi:acetyl esterase/lipase